MRRHMAAASVLGATLTLVLPTVAAGARTPHSATINSAVDAKYKSTVDKVMEQLLGGQTTLHWAPCAQNRAWTCTVFRNLHFDVGNGVLLMGIYKVATTSGTQNENDLANIALVTGIVAGTQAEHWVISSHAPGVGHKTTRVFGAWLVQQAVLAAHGRTYAVAITYR